jgi:beta-galactosidase
MLLLLLWLQVSLDVQQPTADSAIISSSITLKPSAAVAAAATTAGGVGVGEVGGAHWFAHQEAAAAGSGDTTAVTAAAAAGTESQTAASPEGHIHISSTTCVTASGVVTVTWSVDASHALPAQLPPGLKASLPRVGLHALLPHTYESVTWYGLGPHECYPDRKASGRLQQHTM